VPCALVGAALLVYWPVLMGGCYALRDFLAWTLPSRALVREAMLQGRVVLWNPYLGLGTPVLAEPVNGAFYPLHVLLALFPLVVGVNILYLVHILIAGAGGYVLGRTVGASRAGALAAGVVCMLCGVTTSGWASGIGVLTGAWMPWCAAAAVRLGRARLGGVAAMAAALAAAALAGDPFQFARAGLLALPLALGAAVAENRSAWRAAARLALAGALGALLAGVALLPAATLLGSSERAGGLSLVEAERWSLHPIRLVEMIAAGALGNATEPGYAGGRWLADERLGPVPWCYSVYLGFGLSCFAPLALRGRDRLRRALGLAFVIGLLLALGRHTPLHRVARVVLPPLSYSRYPEKYLDLCATAAAALIALGLSDALRAPAAARRWTASAVGALALGALAVWLLHGPATMAPALARASIVGVAVWLALELARHRARLGTALALALLTVDLALGAAPILHWTNAAEVASPPLSVTPTDGQPPPRLYRDPALDEGRRIFGAERGAADVRTLRGNLAAVYGLGVVPGYEAAFDARWKAVWESLAGNGDDALRLLGVGHVLARRPTGGPQVAGTAVGRLVQEALHSIRAPLPRAYLVGQARLAPPGAEAAGALLSRDVVEGRAALVEDPAAVLDGPAARAGRCAFLHFGREHIEVGCEAGQAAMLVLIEAWSAGWEAEVDGAGQPVLRVNGIERGLRLAPGRHRVELRYRPPGLIAGAALSLLGVLALVGLCAKRAPRAPAAGA
jgi:hypothetical protein